ncbi:hypothetical protein BDV96DRAFT_490026 [Lophiotrema nucula]|uniref:MARVEL domain-containing protein n=1 Tax=Lophiotrema nucula TaxID=690887 RepID=A0A6A5ZE65_9PLEO|nr:hypothetical protein BDV96DRAFT_490026 [Lophiotrema nucula]
MAVMNVRIFTQSIPHTLRAISIITFPPAFLVLLITGIVSEQVNPAIGILPLFFSSVYAIILLAHEKRCGCQNSGLTGTPLHLVFDFAIGLGLLICLILTWVHLPRAYPRGMIMLGTYGSNFMITNFLIHLYFVGVQIWELITPGIHFVDSCPECQYGPFANIPKAARGYAPLLDGQGRPAGEEENHDEGPNGVESAV